MSLCILLYKPCKCFYDFFICVEKMMSEKFEVSVNKLQINIQ